MNSGRFQKGHQPANYRPDINEVIVSRYPAEGGALASALGITITALYQRASKLGVSYNGPQIIPNEVKRKISESNKGRYKSEKWRQNLSVSLKGRKHSDDRLSAIIDGLRRSRRRPRRMTAPEMFVMRVLNHMFGGHNPYEYTGNFSFWLTFRSGQRKNPDFASVFHHKVIEVYGSYWHRNDDPEDIVKAYREIGWDCIVIWEHETMGIRDYIMEFTYPYEFDAERKESW